MNAQKMPARYEKAAVAHVMVEDADAAIRFYVDAFGAQEIFRIAHADGRVLHAEVSIGESVFMVGDAEGFFTSPTSAGATTVGLHVFVEDVDTFGEHAVKAGAELLQEPTDMFYGDRTIMLQDPFGHVWVFLTHKEDVEPVEIALRGNAMLASAAEK